MNNQQNNQQEIEEEFDLHNRSYEENSTKYSMTFNNRLCYIYTGKCVWCSHLGLLKWGFRYLKNGLKVQKWVCPKCKRSFSNRKEKRMRIIPYVRESIKFDDFGNLSSRKIKKVIYAKYGVLVSHTTILRIKDLNKQPKGEK